MGGVGTLGTLPFPPPDAGQQQRRITRAEPTINEIPSTAPTAMPAMAPGDKSEDDALVVPAEGNWRSWRGKSNWGCVWVEKESARGRKGGRA